MAKPTKAKAIERLRRALDEIPALKRLPLGDSSPEFEKWRRKTETAISNTFGNDSDRIHEFTSIVVTNIVYFNYLEGLESATSLLESMIEEIEEYWEDTTQASLLLEKIKKAEEPRKDENQPSPSSAAQEDERMNTNGIFIIHGRDDGTKETVARFLENLGLTPVILHEQPNQGRTIIEKLERHAPQAGFAVALLTPDDVGSLRDNRNDLKPRARQNVVFELGYFLGLLGRNRVCALTKGNVELPSDYDGVVYISLDDGGWKMDLIRELKNVGFEVDANKAL